MANIQGPINIGTASQTTDIYGDVFLENATTLTVTSTAAYLVLAQPGNSNFVGLLSTSGQAGNVLSANAAGFPVWVPNGSAASINYSFSAINAGMGAVSSSITATATNWNVTAPFFNTSDNALDLTTGVFTTTTAGHFVIAADLSVTENSNAVTRAIYIVRTGSVNATITASFGPSPHPKYPLHLALSVAQYLSTGDAVSIAFDAYKGDSLSTSFPSYFSVFRYAA